MTTTLERLQSTLNGLRLKVIELRLENCSSRFIGIFAWDRSHNQHHQDAKENEQKDRTRASGFALSHDVRKFVSEVAKGN